MPKRRTSAATSDPQLSLQRRIAAALIVIGMVAVLSALLGH